MALTTVTCALCDAAAVTRAGGDEEGKTGADAFKAAIADKTDELTSGDGEALATLDNVACVYPRGRYGLSLFPGFMDMDGQTHQFKIRFGAYLRLCFSAVLLAFVVLPAAVFAVL
jgi:hypothetical protein